MRLLLVLLLVVLAEISLLVVVGGAIGLPATLAIILGTGVLGGYVLRGQGQRSLGRMTGAVMEPRSLAGAGDGVLVALAGILLILPGFLTDLAGLVLLVPPIRRAVLRYLAEGVRRGSAGVTVRVVMPSGAQFGGPTGAPMGGDIIEGEALDPPNDTARSATHLGRNHR